MITPARKRKREGIGTARDTKDGRKVDDKDNDMDCNAEDIEKDAGDDQRSLKCEEGNEIQGNMKHRNDDSNADDGTNGANKDGADNIKNNYK